VIRVKVCIILGTRPEIIKMSPVIRECEKRGLEYFTIHTGQHYSYEMDRIFFEELMLPPVKYNLDVGSGSQGRQTGRMIGGIEEILMLEKPDIAYVQGDTNTVLAGALAASKLFVKVGHIEAGLRSFDRTMPEEINRVVADHVSDLLFAPTEQARELLLKEGIPTDKIFVTGNTIVDAVVENRKIAERSDVLDRLGLEGGRYMLSTVHRQENVDVEPRLRSILKGLDMASQKAQLPIVLPMHPRTKKMIIEFGLAIPPSIRVAEPVGFMEFLQLEAKSRLVLTDSGGVQEECCILGVPCVTLRENTERPETVDVGANMLAGYKSDRILGCAMEMMDRRKPWVNPFGDGKAGNRIINITEKALAQ